jgi:GTPase
LTTEEEAQEKSEFEDQLDSLNSTMQVRDEFDVRVAVIGNVDSGKSTLVGVLTKGIMDDGRGFARTKVFNFSHEASNGRTSSIG